MSSTSRRVVRFPEPNRVEVVEESLPGPGPHEVQVETLLSAISPGTERLIYQGQAPSDLSADASINALSGQITYPIAYGYAAVGRVDAIGKEVDEDWLGKRVFSFQPHVSHFLAPPENLVALPSSIRTKDGVMIPNVETAVNLMMDGRPMVGEDVVVFGQGVVGLLTTTILSRFPLRTLLAVEPNEARRALAREWGADKTVDPTEELDSARNSFPVTNTGETGEGSHHGADLVYELSGIPSVLNDALSMTGYDGRIIVGSWYGSKKAALDLGGRYHRARISIESSQVSTIEPSYRGRWTKERRMDTVVSLLDSIRPGDLITGEYAQQNASEVYERLVRGTDGHVQPTFRYD